MNFKIHLIPSFLKSLKALSKKYRSLKTDFESFALKLSEDPFQGVEISPGIRKIRMAISSKGRGKSGGARIITYTLITSEIEGDVYLIEIYDKADYDTVDVERIRRIINEIEEKEE